MKSAVAAQLPQTGHYLVVTGGDVRSVALLHQLLHQPQQDLHLQLVCPADATPSQRRLADSLARSYGLALHQAATDEVFDLAKRLRAKVLAAPNTPLEEAEAYARGHGLAWVRQPETEPLIDPLDLRRNQLQDQQRDLDEAVERRLGKLYYQFRDVDGIKIPRAWLAEASWDQTTALLAFAIKKLAPNCQLDSRQVGEWVQQAKTLPAGRRRHLLGSLILRVEYDTVAVVPDAGVASPWPTLELVPNSSLIYGRFQLSYGNLGSGDISIQLPSGQYRVRSFQPGDVITTTTGHRKLQDIFTDKRIDRQQRASWPVITDESDQIVWLPALVSAAGLSAAAGQYTLIAEEV